MIAVNVMVALQQYREHVKEAVRAGADAVICGAGLPVDLPELVEAGKAKIAPIVSSRRAAALLLKPGIKNTAGQQTLSSQRGRRRADILDFRGSS